MEKRDASELKEILKTRYKQHDKIERLFYPEDPLPLAECYLDLGLIEEKLLKVKKADNDNARVNSSKDLPAREHFLHEYERIQHILRKLKVEAILQECKALRKRIYIEGAAGAGKSTLSRFIANEWAHDKAPWNQYEWVFYIRLRDLDTKNHPTDRELWKVVDSELFVGQRLRAHEYADFDYWLQRNPEKKLWILDGYDELNLKIARCTWWKDLLASNFHLLITSRPGAQLLKTEIGINLSLAVLGFNDEQVKNYVSNFFDAKHTPETKSEYATQCLALLKTNINLWSLAHTPIQLELLCSIWHELKQIQYLSLTQLYRIMLEQLLKRCAVNKEKSEEDEGQDRIPLKARYQEHLAYMEYLAFLGMQSKQIVLNEQQINEAYKILPDDKHKQVNFYKELKAIGLIKRYNNGKQAEFAHLTFQEYFAARFVAKAIKAFSLGKTSSFAFKNLFEFITKTKWDPFYEVMWSFVAGWLGGKAEIQQLGLELYELSGGDTNTTKELELPKTHRRLQTLQIFFDLLLQEPRAELEAFELPLLAKCLAEAGMPNIMQKEAIKLHVQSWLEFCWHHEYSNVLKKKALLRLWQTIKTSFQLISWVEPFIVTMRKDKNSLVRIKAVAAVHSLGWTASMLLQAELLALIKDEDRWVRCTAVEAVGALGLAACEALKGELFKLIKKKDFLTHRHAAAAILKVLDKTELQEKFLMLMENKDPIIRRAGIFGVSFLGSTTNEKSQTSLLALLQDKDITVRCDAVKAVGALGIVASMKLHTELLTLIKDENNMVRRYVASAIGSLGSGANDKLQTGLLALLQDKYEDVRMAAAQAVRTLGPMANEILQEKLLVLLKDENNMVRCNVASAIGSLRSAANDKLQNGLLALLQDQDEDVREAAAHAVGTLGPMANEILQEKLLVLLKDEYLEVCEAATHAVRALRDTSSEFLQTWLLALLSDKDISACEIIARALSALGPVAHKTLQEKLLLLTKDKCKYVREATALAVGALGAAVSERHQAELLVLMKDKECCVREAAAQAVGALGVASSEVLQEELVELMLDANDDVREAAAKAVGAFGLITSKVLQAGLLKLLKDENLWVREAAAASLAKTKSGLILFCHEIFKDRPPYIPPSRLIVNAQDFVKVNTQGELDCLKLCGSVLQNIIHDGGLHTLTADCWTLALVRKKPNNQSSIHFFNNLMSHMFLVLEGIENGVRVAYKIDLFAIGDNNSSESRGQCCQIKNILIKDYVRLELLQENCYCMVQGISKKMADQLIENILRDKAAAERGEIIYNQLGDRVSSSKNNNSHTVREHSCVSWCLEKWQEIDLPLNRKWFDVIAVVPTMYLSEPAAKNSKCLVM